MVRLRNSDTATGQLGDDGGSSSARPVAASRNPGVSQGKLQPVRLAITGFHTVIYSDDSDATRTFFSDVLGSARWIIRYQPRYGLAHQLR